MSTWQKIIQALRSGADEIDAGDIQDIAVKRGRPAKSPIIDPNEIELEKIKGKLELGDTPSSQVPLNELDMPAPDIKPNIDDYRLPTANPITERGVQGGGTVPAVIPKPDEFHPLATRGTTMSTEVGPQVIGKGQKIVQAADDAIDATFSEVTPTTGMKDMVWYRRMDPRLAEAAAAIAAFGTVGGIMGGGDEPPVQIPFAKEAGPESIPQHIKAIAQEEKAKEAKISPIERKASVEKAIEADQQMAKVEDGAQSYTDLMHSAQTASNQNTFYNNLLRAANQAGASIASLGAGSQVKADYTMPDALKSTAGQPVSDVKQLMETKSSEQKLKQAQAELADEDKLRDPNSMASQMTRQVLARHGLKVSTAKEARDAGINVQNILLQEMAHKNALSVAQLAKESRQLQKEKDLNEKQRKFAQGLRKEATSGVLGKQYATYVTGQRMASSLEQFAQNPSGYKDYATLMGGLKSLQGDESVVREAEVRLGMSATSAIDAALNHLQKAMTGKMLQPEQRAEMINTIKILTDASRQQYMQSVQPILEQAEMEGIDPSMILSGSLAGAKPQESQGLTTKTVVKKQYSPSRNKTKLIFSDGSEEIVDGQQ